MAFYQNSGYHRLSQEGQKFILLAVATSNETGKRQWSVYIRQTKQAPNDLKNSIFLYFDLFDQREDFLNESRTINDI